MQFDPDRTFGDIHKDSKSLCDNIEEIIDIALVEAPGDEPLNLRFVTPRDQSDDWYLNDACAEYELTAPGYRTDYTAVSYCWSHSQSTAGLAQIPEYNVYDAFDRDLPPGHHDRSGAPRLCSTVRLPLQENTRYAMSGLIKNVSTRMIPQISRSTFKS